MKTITLKITSVFILTLIGSKLWAQDIKDEELKINVAEISSTTSQLMNLEPIAFNYNTDKYQKFDLPTGNQYGFLVNNVKSVFPEMVRPASKTVSVGKNSVKTTRYEEVDTEGLIPLLVAAIKEQQAQIEELRKEIEQLKLQSN